MTNILKNSTLSGFTLLRYFTENSGNTGAIENPDQWEYVFSELYPDDPNRIPQSLHRGKGYVIAAGYRRWEAGYVQRGVQLHKGQRYLAKATFMPDVNFPQGVQADLTAIEWQFYFEGGGDKVASGWRSTGKGAYKQEEETLFVIEAASDVAVDVYFKVKNANFEGNVCDFNLYAIALEEVASDYGGPDVPQIGTAGASASADRVVATIPAEQNPSSNLVMGFAETKSTEDLADVITNADLDIIVPGLRAMSNVTPNTAVVAAFNRLAEVLERLRK